MIERLEPFIGKWRIEAVAPWTQEAGDVEATASFEWVLGGAFVLERSEISIDVAPTGLMLLAANDDGTYTQHYFDSRDVRRVYAMTFDGRVWTLTREQADYSSLDFAQRYVGVFEDDRRTIQGRWEINHGDGWETDFELNYHRLD